MAKIDGWAMICWRGTALSRDGLIGGTTSHTMTLNREMIEKASSVNSRAREYIPGLSDWSLSVERMALMGDTDVSVTDEIADLKAGNVIGICTLIGQDYYVGYAIIESIEVNAPLRGKATARIGLRGTGALSVIDLPNDGFDYTFPIAFNTALAVESETE